MAFEDDLLKRHSQLVNERSTFDALNQEIAELVLPDHAVFTVHDRVQGEKRTQRQFDTTATTSCQQHASAVDSLATPHSTKWHTLVAVDEGLNDRDDVQQYFSDVEDVLYAERYATKAQFAAQIYDVWRTGGVFGTTGFMVADNLGGGLRYRALPSAEVYVSVDAWGNVNELHRKWKLSAAAAVAEYGDKLPEKIKKAAELEPYRKFEFLMCIKANDGRREGYLDERAMPWIAYEMQVEEKTLLRTAGYFSWPIPVYRYDVSPGEWYGRGWASSVLPEIKMINRMRKSHIRQTEKAADPPLLMAEDGLLAYNTNGSAQTPSLGAGDITYGGVSREGKQLVIPLYTGADLNKSEALMERSKRVIQDAALISLFQILLENPKYTATEYLGRMQEKAQLLGPMIGRSISTFLGQVVEREVEILARQGKLPPMPRALQQAGGEFKMQFTSPLTRLMQLGEVTSMREWFADLIPAAEVRPDVLDNIDFDEFARLSARRRGVDPKVVVDKDAREQIRLARTQQAQQQQLLENAGPLAGALKDVAQARSIDRDAEVGRAFQSLRGALKGQ